MDQSEDRLQARFFRLFAQHEAAIHAYVRRLVPRREDSLDVMQEVALVLWKKFGQFDETLDFRGWAFGIAKYQVLAWRRDAARDRLILSPETMELLADETDRAADQLERERQAVIEHCLGELEPEQRAAVTAMYHPGTTAEQLAAEFGRSLAGFYQWIYRIRKLLAECSERVAVEGMP